jgi:hypothetical protein
MPLLETKGAASAQGFGLTLGTTVANYIEDVFSTWLYVGNGGTQTITNGIDLAGKGGLVVVMNRAGGVNWVWTDTVRGVNYISSNSTNQQLSGSTFVNAFNSNGFTGGANVNSSAANYVSWTLREQAKFFDVVTYTGTGSNRTIAHNLGSVPGCIMVKRTDTTADWQVYHRSLANTEYMVLNSTAAVATGATRWNSTTPTSTVFSLGTDTTVNASGGTYVAYLFAHDAGGFGLTGTDNVISCGSFTADGSGNATVNLGYEPQWVMIKQTDDTGSWFMLDIMRGWSLSDDARLFANLPNSETTFAQGNPTATGFSAVGFSASGTFIYIAIRRGPMKVPTTGTSVFNPGVWAGTGSNANISVPFAPDLFISKNLLNTFGTGVQWYDRLRGLPRTISSTNTSSEYVATDSVNALNNRSVAVGSDPDAFVNYSGSSYANWVFQRAPGFFDEVCYTGTTPNLTVAHNLQAIPELMIIKQRGGAAGWAVFANLTSTTMRFGRLDLTNTVPSDTYANQGFLTGQPTASSFTLIGASGQLANNAGSTYVAYLFATCPGVSKVGTFTGTGATQVIDCGFTGGARFVLIKAASTTGNWLVWDSARGIVSGNDPYLTLNTTAAEVTGTDWVDTASSGFELSNAGGNLANSNGVSYIFLAVS